MKQQNGLEERVAGLERQVAEVRRLLAASNASACWEKTVGMFSAEMFAGIFDPGMELREQDRERARKRFKRLLGKRETRNASRSTRPC